MLPGKKVEYGGGSKKKRTLLHFVSSNYELWAGGRSLWHLFLPSGIYVEIHEGVIESQVIWDQLCWREGAFLLVHGELELRVTLTPWEVVMALQPQWASPIPYMVFYFGTTLFHT